MVGRLFLIVGNSGSGKDSILEYAADHWDDTRRDLIVPKRYITRPASPDTEDYHSVTRDEYEQMDTAGDFFLGWESYGILYGVHRDVLRDIEKGKLVIVNVSRQIIEDTKKRFPTMKTIFVWVPLELTIQRIKDRGRENEEQMHKRIQRATKNQDLPGADFIIENTGTIEEAGSALIEYLVSFC